jgi:hypothetical protein
MVTTRTRRRDGRCDEDGGNGDTRRQDDVRSTSLSLSPPLSLTYPTLTPSVHNHSNEAQPLQRRRNDVSWHHNAATTMTRARRGRRCDSVLRRTTHGRRRQGTSPAPTPSRPSPAFAPPRDASSGDPRIPCNNGAVANLDSTHPPPHSPSHTPHALSRGSIRTI